MRLFVDTEFTDLLHCELLSIGIVSEDDREFYAECSDADLSLCSDFARYGVLPQLGQEGVPVLSEIELSGRLIAWLEQFRSFGLVAVCVDHPTDWELFAQLVRDSETLQVPHWLKGISIRPTIDARDVETYWQLHGRHAHHALHDARANRFAFERRAAG